MPTNRAVDKIRRRGAGLAKMQTDLNLVPVPQTGNPLSALAARFGSFANTVQTRLDTSGGGAATLGGTLEAQVERALAQALRSPADGGSTAAMGPPGSGAVATMTGGGVSGTPAMSPYQAALVREARLVQGDLLATLDTLSPLSPFADPGDVAALQALIRVEVETLVAEFGRSTLAPRQQRVRVLIGGLLGWPNSPLPPSQPAKSPPPPPLPGPPLATDAPPNDIGVLVNLLGLAGPLVPTLGIEEQLAGQQVVAGDALQLATLWTNYWALVNPKSASPSGPALWPLWEPGMDPPPPPNSGLGTLGPTSPRAGVPAPPLSLRITALTPPPGLSFADRMIRADLLLPVLAQDADRVRAALDAVGLSTGEQEVTPLTLWSFVDSDLLTNARPSTLPAPPAPPLPQPILSAAPLDWVHPIPVSGSVGDFLDWAGTLAGPGGPDLLRRAGALGLNLLADQADELFWLALGMIDPTASAQMDELADTQVQIEIISLARDLNTLAGLAY